MISIKGLHKFFNKGRQNEIHVINDVSLELPDRGMVAIFGRSGCGKTTLLNVLGGLDDYAEGQLTIDGQSISNNTDALRNRYIGYIFQNYNLNTEKNCFENVADALRLCGIGDNAVIEQRVCAALTSVGMEKHQRRTPDTLSGGQQQRIAIARAIVKNPRIILADEPTGNLDEANTVMIMDLLKAISREHLVIIVTHEANLVDYYCDTVIELHDGKVVSRRENLDADGKNVRDSNRVYLGELSSHRISDAPVEVEYFGDMPSTPIKLKIVNHEGKTYLSVDGGALTVLDDKSEIKLCDGVFTEKSAKRADGGSIDMSLLPPVECERPGRLFTFLSSLKSGYSSNFKGRKRGRKMLFRCLALFAAVLVFMSASFGTAFGDLIDAKNAYNHNVFHVYTPDKDVSLKLKDALLSEEAAIDYLRLDTSYYGCESTVYFHTGSFETFSKYQYSGAFGTNAVYLDTSLCNNMRLVAGKKDNLLNEEILISTTVADALVEKSTLGYISEREDLLGLYASGNAINGKSPRVAGIVESDEPAIYLTPLAMAKYLCASGIAPYTSLASDYGITLNEGETILAITAERADISYPAIGETIKIQDREITVVDIMKENGDYLSWLSDKQIQKLSEEEFFTLLVLRESPEAENDKDALGALVLKAAKEHRYEYFDYLYQELDAFLCDLYFFETWDFHLWLYVKLGIEEAKYLYVPEEYYKAIAYKGIYGAYPTEELLSEKYDSLPFAYEQIKSYVKIYEEQFYSTQYASGIYPNSYLVSDADFIAFSKQIGETHPTAQSPKDEVIYDVMPVATADVPMTDYDDSIKIFTVIHSENPDKTEAWLRDTLGEVTFPGGTREVIITPDSVYESIIGEYIENISSDLVTLGIFLLLMSVCMYFIMRASLINRIKEIGIYRAIGVSSKNLVFRFFTESLLLTTLTAFVGYLISSAFLLYTCSSGAMSDTFYYPVWLALAVLVLLYVISLFFGTLPVIALLRKTPSQILAKYDI